MKWLYSNRLVVLLALLKFLLPFMIVPGVWELHRDEYLYYAQGQHLDIGYLENPPLISFLGYISSLSGGSVWMIKFWPAFIGAATLLITTELTGEFGGRTFAKVIAALGVFFSAYMRIHYMFQPNALEILFWLTSAYFLVRYINTGKHRYLYLLGISLAVSWWSKYSALFFITAIGISILLTYHRKMLGNKHFWLAILAGILIVTPNILWQYYHNWPLLHHMEELRETQLRYISNTDFIKEQILMLIPVVFIWIGGLIWLLSRRRYRIIGYMYLTVITLLMIGSGKGYYALGAYPMLLAAGGAWLEKISSGRLWLRYVALLLILVLSLPLVYVLLPIQSPSVMAAFNRKYELSKMGILKWEDQHDHALQQDFADMIGWKELAGRSERFFNSLPDSDKTNTIIYCRNYGQAGSLKYYAKDASFRDKVISDNGTFLLWIPGRLQFKHLLFVGKYIPGNDDVVFNHFGKVTIIDSVRDELSRSYRTKIIFYQNADDSAAVLASEGLQEMKSVFKR